MSLDGYPAPDPRNLIVNYIPTPVTDVDLRNLFAPFGEIESARVILDKGTGHPKGYGFVKFTNPECAQIAIEKMNGFELQNKRLKVTPAKGPIGVVSNAPTNGYAARSAAQAVQPQQVYQQQPQHAHPQQPQQQQLYQQYPQQYMAAPPQQYHQPQMQQHQPQHPHQHQQQPQQHQQHIMMPYQNTSPMMMNSGVTNYMWFDNNGQMRTMPMVQSMPMQAAPQQHMAAMQHSSSLVPSPQQAHLQYQPTPTRTDNQLPLFPQQLAPPTVIHREGEQGFGTSFNMTLLGVSGMGSGIVSPNGSLDGKAISMPR